MRAFRRFCIEVSVSSALVLAFLAAIGCLKWPL